MMLTRRICYALVGVSIVLYGCDNEATTWSAELASPNGQWIAVAKSQQWGGPGTAYDATTVSLKSGRTSDPPTEIIGFSHQAPTIKLTMSWVTATRLEVSYGRERANDNVRLDL